MHIIDPANFPNADSWAKASSAPSIDHNWLAARAMELLKRRGNGARRIVFVVDEVGQYVARSIPRMFDLQGLAEAFQKKRGPLWLVVTSQEKLSDVVDSLESRQVEYARVQDRFPLRVDLLPSDIHEVTSRRVLDKTDAGQKAVRDRLAAHRGQLNTYVRLDSPTRAADLAEDEFVRLYPLVPYQVQLLIDAVSARRAQGGGSPMLGGSNRTIIKLAQQLVIDPGNGLGDEEVGALVTLDRASRLLEEALPTSWRHEIEQVADKYTSAGAPRPMSCKLSRCAPTCPPLRSPRLTSPRFSTPPSMPRAAAPRSLTALANLVGDDRLRRRGRRLPHPVTRAEGLGEDAQEARSPGLPTPSASARRSSGRRSTGLSVTKGRSFKVELWVEGEKLADGDVALHVEEADTARRDQLRSASREESAANRVTWLYSLSDETYRSIEEWYRSDEMIKSKETPSKTTAEVELLGEERQRLSRIERQLIDRLTRDMTAGQVAFRGTLDDAPSGTIAQAAQKLMTERIGVIYDRLEHFAAQLSTKDVLTVLRTDDLGTVAPALAEGGIGLVHLTPQGYQIATETSPLDDLLKITQNEIRYGHLVTGALLATKLAEPPRGAPVEVVQALCAAAVRSGLLEVTYQGAKIGTPSDHRLDRVFGKLTDFRRRVICPAVRRPERGNPSRARCWPREADRHEAADRHPRPRCSAPVVLRAGQRELRDDQRWSQRR